MERRGLTACDCIPQASSVMLLGKGEQGVRWMRVWAREGGLQSHPDRLRMYEVEVSSHYTTGPIVWVACDGRLQITV